MPYYNVEFAYYDPEGRKPFDGIYDDPINDEPIEADNVDEAESIARGFAEEMIIANANAQKIFDSEEVTKLIDEWNESHIARVIQITG